MQTFHYCINTAMTLKGEWRCTHCLVSKTVNRYSLSPLPHCQKAINILSDCDASKNWIACLSSILAQLSRRVVGFDCPHLLGEQQRIQVVVWDVGDLVGGGPQGHLLHGPRCVKPKACRQLGNHQRTFPSLTGGCYEALQCISG